MGSVDYRLDVRRIDTFSLSTTCIIESVSIYYTEDIWALLWRSPPLFSLSFSPLARLVGKGKKQEKNQSSETGWAISGGGILCQEAIPF